MIDKNLRATHAAIELGFLDLISNGIEGDTLVDVVGGGVVSAPVESLLTGLVPDVFAVFAIGSGFLATEVQFFDAGFVPIETGLVAGLLCLLLLDTGLLNLHLVLAVGVSYRCHALHETTVSSGEVTTVAHATHAAHTHAAAGQAVGAATELSRDRPGNQR